MNTYTTRAETRTQTPPYKFVRNADAFTQQTPARPYTHARTGYSHTRARTHVYSLPP